MKIALANDHAAVELKKHVLAYLESKGHEVLNFGTDVEERTDYPVRGETAARAVAEGRAERGILLCGTGVGISLAANKVHGIRAAAVSEVYSAKLTRQHNDANMVCIGARVIGPETAKMIVEAFLTTPFEGGRHQKRVDMITDIENRESN